MLTPHKMLCTFLRKINAKQLLKNIIDEIIRVSNHMLHRLILEIIYNVPFHRQWFFFKLSRKNIFD